MVMMMTKIMQSKIWKTPQYFYLCKTVETKNQNYHLKIPSFLNPPFGNFPQIHPFLWAEPSLSRPSLSLHGAHIAPASYSRFPHHIQDFPLQFAQFAQFHRLHNCLFAHLHKLLRSLHIFPQEVLCYGLLVELITFEILAAERLQLMAY